MLLNLCHPFIPQDKCFKEAGQCYINALRDIIPIIEPGDGEDVVLDELKTNLYSNLAACQLKLHQYDRVIINCNKSLEINNDNVKCLYRRANAFLEQKDKESAEKDIKRILELEPENSAVKELGTKLTSLKMDADNRDAAIMKNYFAAS